MAQSQSKKSYSTRNPVARDLSDRRYRQRVVKDKTKYSRKEKHGQTNRHYEHSDSSKTST